jgi:DNA-binding beta-propeller fold protein YncE
VLAFDRDGKALGPLPEAAGRLAQPFGVAVGADGKVHVSDAREDALFEFDADGKFLARTGVPGLGRGEFAKPKGLAFDGAGELIVLDWGNHRGQLLAADGKSLTAFGSRLFTRAFRNGR